MNKDGMSAFFAGILVGMAIGIFIVVITLRSVYFPAPKIVGFQETGYFVKYQNRVYQLTPQTTDSCGSGKTQPNTESLK